ncbi:MAG TPA: T9SS type A sorting domain-containing protein [Bacteroidia bacterium]|nr:T9SS type A sorting domain-containing protein [Bacteroidia bacterium]
MKKFTLILTAICIAISLPAQTPEPTSEVTVIPCSHFGISRPLSELFVTSPAKETEIFESRDRENRKPQTFMFTAEDGPEYGNDPATMQKSQGLKMPVTIIKNWAGQNGVLPPDPTGAAGLTHYIQLVNATKFKIFNKSTGAQVGTIVNLGTLWNPDVGNLGDPIVLYDKYADRWFLSQFGSGSQVYIAISTTGDPTGTYYTYTFLSPQFPDYQKFSVWADGYYMTSNQSSDKIFCFERDKMLIGDAAARSLSRTFSTGPVSNFFLPLPADADGQLPPLGTPCPFFAYSENSWGSGAVDGVRIRTLTVNWLPAPTTPTATVSAVITVPTAAFDGTYNSGWNDIPQPGTTVKLDGIGGVVQFRAQWRKWVGYNSVVLNWPVRISSTQRSIKWVELRQNQSTGTWSLFQEGIYTPDASSRWMGSIAMDDNGSISLCYAKSSSATGNYPSLAFTGRIASDPPGQMSFGETVAFLGTGSQTITNRFGDYSQTSLDPDGITFWHTGEYLGPGGATRTRIYSFQLPTIIGVEENFNNAQFSVYQSGTNLIVNGNELLNNNSIVVDLFDVQGKQLSGKTVTPADRKVLANISIAGLARGTYLVRVGNEKFQKVIKVMID